VVLSSTSANEATSALKSTSALLEATSIASLPVLLFSGLLHHSGELFVISDCIHIRRLQYVLRLKIDVTLLSI
jgi:hypothetical protein